MKTGMNFVKGMGIGAVVGSVAGMVGYSMYSENRRSVKKSVSKALKNASQLVDNMGSIF